MGEANTQLKYGRPTGRSIVGRGRVVRRRLKMVRRGGASSSTVWKRRPFDDLPRDAAMATRRWRGGGVNPPARHRRLKKHRPRRRGGPTPTRASSMGVRARRQASRTPYETLPPLGGGHPLVVVAEAGAHGGGGAAAEVLLQRLQTLTKDNDATPCKIDRRQNRRGLDAAPAASKPLRGRRRRGQAAVAAPARARRPCSSPVCSASPSENSCRVDGVRPMRESESRDTHSNRRHKGPRPGRRRR